MTGRLAKKSAWLIGGHVVANGLSLAFFIVLARAYGAEGMGTYSFAFALAALFGLAINFGLRNLLTREAARFPGLVTKTAGTVVATQTALSLLCAVIIFGVGILTGHTAELQVLVLLAFVAVAFQEIGGSFVAFLEAVEAMERSAILEVLARAVLLVTGLTFIAGGAGLRAVMLAHMLSAATFLVLAFASARKLFGPLSIKLDGRLALRGLRSALPFFMATILYELYSRIDIIMIHQMRGEAETGLYSVAVKLESAPVFVASLIGVAVFPALARSGGQPAVQRDLFLGSLKWIGVLGMGGALLLLLVGEPLTTTFFGPSFSPSGHLLRWMSILFLIQFVAVAYWRFLYALDRERLVLVLYAASMVLNISFNLLLIPRWGGLGAVWASIISEGAHAVALHVACTRHVQAPYARHASRLLLVGAASWACLALAGRWTPWPLLLALLPPVFVGSLAAFRIVTKADFRDVREALRNGAP